MPPADWGSSQCLQGIQTILINTFALPSDTWIVHTTKHTMHDVQNFRFHITNSMHWSLLKASTRPDCRKVIAIKSPNILHLPDLSNTILTKLSRYTGYLKPSARPHSETKWALIDRLYCNPNFTKEVRSLLCIRWVWLTHQVGGGRLVRQWR